MKKLNIALLGLGTVGSGVIKIIREDRQQIQGILNKDIVIKHILVRDKSKKRPLSISQHHLTEDVNEILNDDSLDIIVEVMGGIEPTVDWLRIALKNKKHVITVNKDLLVAHLKLLEDLAEENGVALKFKASVAGNIPIVNAMNNGLNASDISKFMGILNGTSNFILSKMTKEQTTFEEALDEAERLGFAETDPVDDVEGVDVARKVVITSYLSSNQVIKLNDVRRRGISGVTLTDINVVDQLEYKIKLIGKGIYESGKVNAPVEPTLTDKKHQLTAVEDEYNAIYVISGAVGDTMFYGKGAGSLATDSVVVSDLLNVALFFESDLYTLPPHFELKTDKTREIMDSDAEISIKEKSNLFMVMNHAKGSIENFENELKAMLPFHRSSRVANYDNQSYTAVTVGSESSPEELITKHGYEVDEVYPVEGV